MFSQDRRHESDPQNEPEGNLPEHDLSDQELRDFMAQTGRPDVEEVREVQELPVAARLEEIVETVRNNRVTVLVAETGAGKSVLVPSALRELGRHVVVTEPRVLAASGLAMHVAERHGEEVGKTFGYKTALYEAYSDDTEVLYCTDGVEMIRQIVGHSNNTEQVLIIDEIHEWNTNMEVLLAWVKHELSQNPDLKLVIMTATLHRESLLDYFSDIPDTAMLDVEGRQYPVVDLPAGSSIEADIEDMVNEGRNVLVFQPGKKEIARCIEALEERGIDAEIIPLHGELTLAQQQEVFKRFDKPKVVVATPVAETSITIDDIDAVIDSGLSRQVEVRDDIMGLYLVPISKAQREQRKGRAGRCKPGVYIDHCKAALHKRPDFPVPELLRIKPDQAVLRLKAVGIDLRELPFFHQPSEERVEQALKTLRILGCLDKHGEITKLGKQVSRLPVSAESGRMIIEAQERGVLNEIVSVAAIMEAGGILDFSSEEWHGDASLEHDSELLLEKNIFDVMREKVGVSSIDEIDEEYLQSLAEYHGVNARSFTRALESRMMILEALGVERTEELPSTENKLDMLKSIASGLVHQVYTRCGHGACYEKNGDLRYLSRDSAILKKEWMVGIPFDLEIPKKQGSSVLHLLTKATGIEKSWLSEVAPQLLEERDSVDATYSLKNDSIFMRVPILFGDVCIDEMFVEDMQHPAASKAFAGFVAEVILQDKLPKRARKITGFSEVVRKNKEIVHEVRRQISTGNADAILHEALTEVLRTQLEGRCCFAQLEGLSRLEIKKEGLCEAVEARLP